MHVNDASTMNHVTLSMNSKVMKMFLQILHILLPMHWCYVLNVLNKCVLEGNNKILCVGARREQTCVFPL